jgi:hypothetical protein
MALNSLTLTPGLTTTRSRREGDEQLSLRRGVGRKKKPQEFSSIILQDNLVEEEAQVRDPGAHLLQTTSPRPVQNPQRAAELSTFTEGR